MKRVLIMVSDDIEVYHEDSLVKKISSATFENLLKVTQKYVRDTECEDMLFKEFNKYVLNGCEAFFDATEYVTVHFKSC